MLAILSSQRQTGKTCWLESAVARASRAGIPTYGVLAPGRWRRLPTGALEKTGIDNVLLPGTIRIVFATAAASGCGWDFSDGAIARVNEHLTGLRSCAAAARPGLLAIDELGPLELVRGKGLTEALTLLDLGPQPAWPHAIVVVRPELCDQATQRFSAAWGTPAVFGPMPKDADPVLCALGLGEA